MYKIRFQHSVTLLLCLIAGTVFASSKLPKHYPSKFDISGTITEIIKKDKLIILDGMGYKFHPIHDIFTHKKNIKAALYELKPGMKIGGKFSIYKGKQAIYEIWILPKDYPTMKHAH